MARSFASQGLPWSSIQTVGWTGCLILALAWGGPALRAAQGQGPTGVKPEPPPAAASSPQASSPPRAGRRVQIDPRTGRIVTPTLAQRRAFALSPETLEAMSTSHRGLYEEVLPNGAVKVNLQGRFRNLLMATVDDDGNLRIGHGLVAGASDADPRRDVAGSAPQGEPHDKP